MGKKLEDGDGAAYFENEIERFEKFEFIAPPVMVDDDLELKLEETYPYRPKEGYVPEYKFVMVNTKTLATMGNISLRVGLTKKLSFFGGHIGYEVAVPYRGHHYAARSCRMLFPFLRELGINPVVITCAPENIASVKTIEALGAALVVTKNVEVEPSVYRLTNIYHLYL